MGNNLLDQLSRAENEWQALGSRLVYHNADGRILGDIYKCISGAYLATFNGEKLGEYLTESQAKKAVEARS